MNCTDALDLMQAFVDGELDEVARQRLIAHTRDCDACRLALEQRQRLVKAAGTALGSEAPAPAGLAPAVSARLSQEPALTRGLLGSIGRPAPRLRRAGLAVAAAAALALATAALLALRGPHSATSAPTAALHGDRAGSADSTRLAHQPATSSNQAAPELAGGGQTRRTEARMGDERRSVAVPQPASDKRSGQPLFAVTAARQPVRDGAGKALQVGERLSAGASVRTGAEGRVTLITRRGSEFTLSANTELALSSDGRSAALRAGRIYCRSRLGEFAAVTTPAGRIQLLGTTVDAAVRKKETVAVTVVEGKVRLSNAHGEALVDSGRKAVLIASLPPDAGEPVNTAIETAWYDGRGEVLSDFGEIAYSIRRVPQLVSEVWAMNADGTGKHRVRSYVGSNWSPGPWLPGEATLMVGVHSPVWTFPDFEKRSAIANRGSSMFEEWRQSWLLDVAAAQDIPFELAPGFAWAYDLALSPDGTRAAFTGVRRTGPDLGDYEGGLWVYDLRTGELIKLLGGGWNSPAWSPDGSMIAASERHSSNADYRLVLVNVHDGTVTEPGVQGTDAAFSPDGTRIAYVDDYQEDYGDGTWMSDVGRIYVLDLVPGRRPQLVSPATERSSRPRWSPDGQQLLYGVRYYRRGDPVGESPRSLVVAASDGTEVREVYNPGPGYWKEAAWAPSGDAIYVTTEEGVLLVDPDGSGVLANLGGNEEDSLLSPAEQRQTDAAVAAIQEAIFQYAVGRLREFEGKPAEAKERYQTAADIFAGLLWEYPLVDFSASNALMYADNLAAMADRPAEAMQPATCKSHLNHLSLLLPWYANEHDGVFPADFSELAQWTATKNEPDNETMINEWQISRPEVAAATSKCPMGDAYVYTPPAPGALPKVGDVLLTCPNHPEVEVVWEENRDGKLEPKHLEGFSIGPAGPLALEPRDTE